MVEKNVSVIDAQELIAQIKAGDERAFEALFSYLHQPLFEFTWHLVRSEAAAADLVQNVFVKLWQNREGLRQEASIRSYLFRAAKNSALNYIRDSKTDRFEELSDQRATDAQPDQSLEKRERAAQIQKCIDTLPEKCRNIFIMSRYEDSKYREIAETLEISIKTVENQMGKALKLLRDCLQPILGK